MYVYIYIYNIYIYIYIYIYIPKKRRVLRKSKQVNILMHAI